MKALPCFIFYLTPALQLARKIAAKVGVMQAGEIGESKVSFESQDNSACVYIRELLTRAFKLLVYKRLPPLSLSINFSRDY